MSPKRLQLQVSSERAKEMQQLPSLQSGQRIDASILKEYSITGSAINRRASREVRSGLSFTS